MLNNYLVNNSYNLLRGLIEQKRIDKNEAQILSGLDDFNFEKLFGDLAVDSRYRKINILVCGGAGFIGSNFIHYMLEKYPGYNVVCFDKLTYAGNRNNHLAIEHLPNYNFVQGDITDLPHVERVIQENKITHIINFAAETHVDRSIHGDSKDFIYANTLGAQTLLEAVRSQKIEKFIHISTDEVYGDTDFDSTELFTEDSQIKPSSPYAASKAGGDLICRSYYHTHKTPVIVTHCSNNYGPFQFPEKMIPFFLFKLLKGEKVPVYGSGRNVRDMIHVRDHVRALDLLLHKGQPGEVYNIGSENERNNLEITRMILKIVGKDESSIEYVTDRPGHDRRYAINSEKIRALGWTPEYTREHFEKGLRETIEWYLNNRAWVDDLWRKQNEMNNWMDSFVERSEKPLIIT